MATATTSTAPLTSDQRAWLKKMGAALDAPVQSPGADGTRATAASAVSATAVRDVKPAAAGAAPAKTGAECQKVDAASSCHITVTNDTKVVLTFGGSGHERGNFMTPPAKKLNPGDSTKFVSVEVPNAKEKKEEGCKGHVLWQVGSPNVLWRIEWDNPEQQQNVVSHSFNPPNPGFNSANFIGQGEENVPVEFTISGDGGGQITPPPPPGTGSKVTFTVIDADGDKVLSGATVQAAGKSAKTSGGGTAVLELPAGPQAYVVTADGFEDNKGTVEVKSGQDGDQTIFMKKRAPSKVSKITFKVIDADADKPLDNATVEAAGKSAKTAGGGKAVLELPAGNQAYVVKAAGFVDNKGTIEVVSGKDGDQVVFMKKGPPTKGSKVTFTVIDAAGDKVLPGASVQAAGKSAKTGGGGTAVLELPAGPQAYVVTADGFEPNKGTVEVKSGQDGDQTVFMKKGAPTKGCKITFKVINAEDKKPIDEATVEAAGKSAKTAGGGKAVLELPAGKQAYVVKANGFEDNKGSVEVVSGKDAEHVVLMKKRVPTKVSKITFKVIVADADKPLDNASVEAAGKSAKTAGGGKAVLELPAGNQAYVVKAAGFVDNKGTIEVVSGKDGERVVFMKKGPPTKVSKITFKVLNADDKKPIDGATVDAAGKSAKTAGGGTAVLELPAGKQAYVVKATDFEDNNGSVEVVEGKDGEQVVLMKKKPPTGTKTKVKFTVTAKESGDKISGAKIKLGTKSGETDGSGILILDTEPGSQSFLVQKGGFQDATGKVDAKPDVQTDQAVQLEKESCFNPPPESKQPTLKKGMNDADGWVEYLQKLLNKYLGANTVPEDGKFDQKTFDAVKKFQGSTEPKCLVDGVVGNETWSMLRKGPREAVGVNKKGPEKGAEGRWATEKNDFVTYDAGSDELRMVAFSVGDAPIDKFNATFKITSADKKVTKCFAVPIGAPTGPSPTGSGHMHLVKVPQMSVIYGTGEHDIDTYLDEELGGDRWTGKVKVTGTGPSTKTGDIGFTVTTDDKDGKPIAGATVTLAGQPKTTDASGVALFAKAPAGKHPFTVSHKDFEPASGDAEVIADASTPKSVKLKKKAPAKTGDIGFTVTDEKSGTPVAGATVTLAGQAKQTDAAGIALYSKFAAGKHRFAVSHKDFQTATGEAEVLADASTSKSVKLKAKPPGSKTGDIGFTVTNEKSGAVVTGATVTMAGVSKSTDASGIALFANAPAAKHKFTVSHKDFEPFSGEAEVVADASTPKSVKLKPKPPGTKTGDIGFTVTDEKTGKPVSGATVSLAGQTKTTDASGVALYAKFAAGKHPFTVTKGGYKAASGQAEVLADASTPKAVKLTPDSSPPPGTGNLGFVVTDEKTGAPITGATVTMAGKSVTTALGVAEFKNLLPGSFPYTVSHSSYDTGSGVAEVDPDTSKSQPVKLKPKSSPPSGATGAIGIGAVDATTGLPIPSASVTIAGQTKSTDGSGTALFDKVPSGKQRFSVSHSNYESASDEAEVLANSSASKTVKLKPKSTPKPGAQTGDISFNVTDAATGAPIAGASVSLAGTTKPTDGSGVALFADAPAGTQAFTVNHLNYQSASGDAQVAPNASSVKDVKLKPKSSTTPKDPDGSPDGSPAEHRLVSKKTYTHKVFLKDTNYINEQLGHWLLRMEVGISGTGQVYPLHVDLIPKLNDPANTIINIFPTIKAKSENLNGKRSCDINFTVEVAGPNVTSSSGGKIGGSIGWKDATERLEAGLSFDWTVTESHNSRAGGAWARRFLFSGGDVIGFSQDSSWKEDLSGDMIIDDDDGHDQWGPDTDWHLHTYDE